MGYSWDYCHSMLYAIRRVHRLARINLDIRDEAMPLLSMFRKGLKRMRGAPKRKLPVTPKLLLEVYNNGGLDLESWDGALTWFGMLMGFYFLLRSSEYLRKGAEPDEFKCVRWRNVTWARNHSTEDAPQGVPCDEVVLFHEYSKNDFLGQGTDNNIKCNKDSRLCIPPRCATQNDDLGILPTLTPRSDATRKRRKGNTEREKEIGRAHSVQTATVRFT